VPSRYEIRVNGRVSDELAGALGLRADVRPVETTLSGDVRDRVELNSLLHRLSDLGLDVIEFRRSSALSDDDSPTAPGRSPST
jgi:hypothetical protein